MTYLLIYLALGLPVVIVTALAGQDSTGKRIAQAIFFLPLWPVFPVAVAWEWLTLKRIHEKCFWCGEYVAPMKAPDREERWREHHLICTKHPLNEVIAAQAQEIEALRAENEKLRHGFHDLVLEQLHHSIKNRLLDRQAPELKAARAVCEVISLWAGVEMVTLHPDIAKALAEWQKARGEG